MSENQFLQTEESVDEHNQQQGPDEHEPVPEPPAGEDESYGEVTEAAAGELPPREVVVGSEGSADPSPQVAPQPAVPSGEPQQQPVVPAQPQPAVVAPTPVAPQPVESKRGRRKREREERKLRVEAEKERKKQERAALKQQRAEQRRAQKEQKKLSGRKARRARSAESVAPQPPPETSPAAEAVGSPVPAGQEVPAAAIPPAFGQQPAVIPVAEQAPMSVPAAAQPAASAPAPTGQPVAPASISRKEMRAAKKREAAERKALANTERERARAERRHAIEQRREQRVSSKAAKKAAKQAGKASAPTPEAVAAAPTPPAAPAATASAPNIATATEVAQTAQWAAAERLADAERREEEALIRAQHGGAEAEAERRVREMEQIQRVAEQRVGEAELPSQEAKAAEAVAPPPFVDELRATDVQINRRNERDLELREELDRAETRLASTREGTEQALEEARRRLDLIESQAGEAEERAARAERLAELKSQEAERERRLHEMLARINEAESRAREAEARARQAVVDVARPEPLLEPPPVPLPPEPEPESIAKLASDQAEERAAQADALEPPSWVQTDESPAAEPVAPDLSDEEPAALLDEMPAPATEVEPQQPAGATDPDLTPSVASPEEMLNLNTATFEQIRAAGLSVTQTGRVLAHRERTGGFTSVDELDAIPGFPKDFLDTIKYRLAC